MTKIFKSSTESTISTSLIQCILSVGYCEQVHTSVLNLIFQQANVADVGNLSKWRSEICSRCWSAPWFFENLPSLISNEYLAGGLDWHLGSKVVSGVWRSLVTCVCSDTLEIHGFNPWQGDEEDAVGFTKTFPNIVCVLRAPHRLTRPAFEAHPGAITFPPKVSSQRRSSNGPSASRNTFSVTTVTDGNAWIGGRRTFPALTLTWLYIEPPPCGVTQSIATPEPSSTAIPTPDRALVARWSLECVTTPGSRRSCPGWAAAHVT